MLAASLLVTGSIVLVANLMPENVSFAVASLAVAIGAATGRLAFDSLLQRDGPDAARGRAFARFETRFQVAWVIGALVGIVPQNEKIGHAHPRDLAGRRRDRCTSRRTASSTRAARCAPRCDHRRSTGRWAARWPGSVNA